MYHIVRSMNYFKDADIDPLPKMLISVSWEDVKKYFHNASIRLAQKSNLLS